MRILGRIPYVLRFSAPPAPGAYGNSLDRLLGGDVVILLQHHAACTDGSLKQRRRGGLPRKRVTMLSRRAFASRLYRPAAWRMESRPASSRNTAESPSAPASIREVEITPAGEPSLSRRRISSSLARRWAGYMGG